MSCEAFDNDDNKAKSGSYTNPEDEKQSYQFTIANFIETVSSDDSFAELGLKLFYGGFTMVLNTIIAPDTVSACFIWLVLGVFFDFLRRWYGLPCWYMVTTFVIGLAISLTGVFVYVSFLLYALQTSQFKEALTLVEQQLVSTACSTEIYIHVMYATVYLSLLVYSYCTRHCAKTKSEGIQLV